MRLEFDEDDLKPHARGTSTRYIKFEHLADKAQAAVKIVGRGMFFRMKDTPHQTHQAIHPPRTDEVETEYRELEIIRVCRIDDRTHMHLKDCAVVFICDNNRLRSQGVDPEELTEGRKIRIKGHYGNEDVMLATFDAFKEIHLVPIEITA